MMFLGEIGLRGIVVEQLAIILLVSHRREREVHIFELLRIAFYRQVLAPQSEIERRPAVELDRGVSEIGRIELPHRDDRKTRTARQAMAAAEKAALQRMNIL